MRYNFFILVIILSLFISCRKYNKFPDDIGTGTIYGRLFLIDTLTGNGSPIPQGKKTIYISYKSDSSIKSNFLFTVNTDSAGYFIFNYLRTDSLYRIQYVDTTNGLTRQADTVLKAGTDTLALVAHPILSASTGFEYIFRDAISNGAIAGVQVDIFTSAILAYADTSLGSNYQLVSDPYGRAYKFGILQGKYYALIKTNYPTLTVNRLDSFTLSTDTSYYINNYMLP